MSKKFDEFIKKFFQSPYDWIKGIKMPKFLVLITDILYRYVKIGKLADIIKVAYEILKEVESEGVPGYIKKQKVTAAISKFAKSLGLGLSSTIINFINETVALYIQISGKF